MASLIFEIQTLETADAPYTLNDERHSHMVFAGPGSGHEIREISSAPQSIGLAGAECSPTPKLRRPGSEKRAQRCIL